MFFPRLDTGENLVWFPLRPYKIVVFPIIKVAHGPPESRFKSCSDYTRIVAATNVIFIRSERSIWELRVLNTIRLQYLDQEFSVVFFFELKISLLVFWISKVFTQLLDLLREIFKAVDINLILWFCLLSWSLDRFDGFTVWTILHTILIRAVGILSICLSLLGLFGVVVFLEVLFSHFSLDDHQTGVDEGLLEKLTFEHSNQVFDANIFSRWPFNNATVSLNLLLLGQCLLRIGLTLFSESCLMLLKQFGGLLESILGILAVDTLIVKFSSWRFNFREYF